MKQLIAVSFLLIGMFVFAACTPRNTTGGELSASSEETELAEVAEQDAAEVEAMPAGLDPNDPMVQDYAEQFGISPEEAAAQLGFEEEIATLVTALEANERDSFAGLWIQHEPEYRIIVVITEDGEETIRPYIEGQPYEQYVEVRTSRYTQEELEAAEQEVWTLIAEFAPPLDLMPDPVGPHLISASSAIDVSKNRVEVTVLNPDQFLAALDAAGRELPEAVELYDADPNNLMSLRGEVKAMIGPNGQTIYFPTQAPRGIATGVGFGGVLTLDENGCLRVGSEGSEALVVIWGYDFDLRVTAEAVEVLNEQGEVVGRAGEAISLGGEEVPAVVLPGASLESCPGPYWVLHGIQPLEEQGPPDDVQP